MYILKYKRSINYGILYSLKVTAEGMTYKIIDPFETQCKTDARKWLHQFGEQSCIIYAASLADFDLNPSNSCDTWRGASLQEQLEYFDYIMNNPVFQNTSVILLLNKQDIFIAKLMNNPQSFFEAFPDFETSSLVQDNFGNCILTLGDLFTP